MHKGGSEVLRRRSPSGSKDEIAHAQPRSTCSSLLTELLEGTCLPPCSPCSLQIKIGCKFPK